MRRVLYLDPVGEVGGAERVVLDLIGHLDRDRFEPMLVSLEPGPLVEEASAAGARALALPPHRTREPHRLLATLARLRAIGRSWRPHLVHANLGSGLLFGRAAAAGAPVVWHVYDPIGPSAFDRFFVAIQRHLRAQHVLFGTYDVEEHYRRAYPWISAHDTVLPGVAPASRGDAARAREALGVGDGPLVLSLSRMQRHKGLHHLLAAAALLPADVTTVFCGGALFGLDEDYPEALAAEARRLGVDGRVRFTGFVDDQTKADLLAAADVFVHPAEVEPFGIAVLEAMVAGVPVVVTDAVGPARLVDDGATGIVVPRRDAVALAEGVRRTLADRAAAAARAEAARLEATGRYSVPAMVRAVEKIYEAVLR